MTSILGGKFWSGFASGALSSVATSAWSGGESTSSYHGAGISAFYFIGVRNTPDYFDHKAINFNELRRTQIDNTRVRN